MDPLTAFTDISLDDEPVRPTPVAVVPRASTATSGTTATPRFVRWMIRVHLLEASASAASWKTTFDRLQSAYEQCVASHPLTQEEEEGETLVAHNEQTAPAETASPDLDPLTAMVQATESEAQRLAAMDLAYRKERALRNRGQATARMLPESEDYDEAAAALIVLDKDLDRLADPHTTTTVTGARKALLRQVLFVTHCEYPDPGYRQGMHEIASYLLYALELDDASGVLVVEASYRPALTYHVLVQVLRGMRAAFDVHSSSAASLLPTATGPSTTLAQIGRRVDHFVRTHDPLLGQRLASLQVPPQMYFLKWIRLLFSREVQGVLEFWDEAFLASPSNTQALDWMPLLEALTAARLLVWSAHLMSLPDEGQLLQTLMNLQVEPETKIWCGVARDLLQAQGAPIRIPPENRQYRPPVPGAPTRPPPAASSNPLRVLAASSLPTPAPSLKNLLGDVGSGAPRLGGWMDKLSSKTQVLGQRVRQEWEQLQAATNAESQDIYTATTPVAPTPDAPSNYSLTYRGVTPEPALYDPPVPTPAPPPQTAAPRPLTRNMICQRLDRATGSLHTYLVQQQQQQPSAPIPPDVWQALADLQKLAREVRPRHP